jgi:hypothetical protein
MTIKPGIRAKLVASREYLDAMRRIVPVNATAPLSIWAGERDEVALKDLGAELGVKGPVQRLLAALTASDTG